ncbi:efflux RND transporter periplasmic adaptor subunit [uncultured Paludibaculum sp.]|uniref:efflux RND transporter periplasmic adaptor subunit n=1 Tax=uncultured Paludibaculum sp. TaxID=1765020 RepID=UPI002AAA9EDA|nr:efflux RND transporter periplasmic adaptor subunit [uncultured Paludibaculum sp.]
MFCSNSTKLLTLGLAALSLAGCGGEKPAAKKAEDGPAVKVSVVKATQEDIPDEYVATGTIKARTTSVLSARVMGYIRELKPQAGDTVKAGQVVAVLEAKEIETGLRQAEAAREEARGAIPEVDNAIAAAKAQLDLADSTFRRMQSLHEQKSITAQEFDEVAARRRMAQANFEMAKAKRTQLDQKILQAGQAVAQASVMRGYTEVLAPFTGTVIERKAEPGMLAAPGMPLLVVEQAGSYRLEAAVEEARLRTIRPGMAVKVDLEAVDHSLDARVEEIVPAMDPASRSFTVKIGLAGAGTVRSGMFGRARFPQGSKQALTVPALALMEQGQVQRVFVIDNGIARGRLVTTGARTEGRVEVLSGLQAGEQVVSPAPTNLADGGKVEVRQ